VLSSFAQATVTGSAFPWPLFPFWLAPGAAGTLLIAAEGGTEDTDPGGVFSFDGVGTFKTLARPRDPDQVLQSGSTVLVAAHGDHEVLAIAGGLDRPLGSGLIARRDRIGPGAQSPCGGGECK